MATSRTSPAAPTTITLRRRGALAVAATVVAATSLGVTATAYAKNGGESKKDVRSSVACGNGSLKLKAKSDDGSRLELEAEVDRNVVGEKWTISFTDNGKTVWTGERTTAGASGSFSVETTINADGTPTDVPTQTPTDTPTDTPTGTPTDAPTTGTTTTTSDDGSSTTTTAPATGDDSSSTTTTAPATGDDSSSTTTTAPTTGEDNPSRTSDDSPGFRVSSKGGDDKPGDDKGGQSKPGNGKHEIGVSATLDTLNCATKVTL